MTTAREIKFRVWDKQKEQIVMYPTNELLFAEINDQYGYESSRFVLMQYTGLKDKNGVEIYEGDIVRSNQNTVQEVKYFMSDYSGMSGFVPMTGSMNMEVIGNIYQNPELLEISK